MKTSRIRRMYAVVPTALLVCAALLGACTPGSEITASESDVVVTLFNSQFDFGSVKYYAMPDTVIDLTADPDDPGDPLIPADDEQKILDLVTDQFTRRGYTKVDTNNTQTPPQFLVIVSAQAVDNYSVYSYYPWYPWGGWGYYWWYYPPSVGVSYAFTLGTLFIQMGDFAEFDPDDPDKNDPKSAYWMAAHNGVLNDSSGNVERRFTNGILQMFDQSPYLKTNL
jgi:hypothetical protein